MTEPASPRRVGVRSTKWGGRRHWEHDAWLLGADGFGTWLGIPAGTVMTRPGVSFETDVAQVVLVPDAPYVASFYARGGRVPVEVYVDITTVPGWDGETVSAVDLDLDVLRGWSGRVWVDDEDEFARHRVVLGYPAEVVALATRSCASVLAAVVARQPPYDARTHHPWLAAVASISSRPPEGPSPRGRPADAPRGSGRSAGGG